MTDDVKNVLFLCTGNSARSILGEALMTHLGQGRFRGFSAGSDPKGEPHPVALTLLKSKGHDISDLRSKSWTDFSAADAPHMDFIITVCDNAANETCPFWPGHPASAHWGLPDPAAFTSSPAACEAAFQETYENLQGRITDFVNLPFEQLSTTDLRQRLDRIGLAQNAKDT